MYFTSIMTENKSILDFIDSNYTFLNEPLAKHYGISGVDGDNFRMVTLDTDERGGVLTIAIRHAAKFAAVTRLSSQRFGA